MRRGLSRNEPYPDHHADTLEILLKAGADATVNDRCGFFGTSPQAAIHNDNLALVRKPLAAGAEVTEDGNRHYGGCLFAASGLVNRKLNDRP